MLEIFIFLLTLLLANRFGIFPSLDKFEVRGPYANRVFHKEYFTKMGNAVSVFYASKTLPDESLELKNWMNYEGDEANE